MEPSILRFILFVGAEILFMGAVALGSILTLGYLISRSGELKNSYASATMVVASVTGTGAMILFSLILTGDGHYVPFLIILVASLATALLVEFLWLIFGSTNVPWFGRSVWASHELARVHPLLHMLVQLASFAVLIGFPVYVGIGYFGDEFGSEQWPKYVVKAIIVMLIGASMLAQLPAHLYFMMSRNLMEGTRSRAFMVQLASGASLLLLASLFVWTTNTEGKTMALLGEHFVFSSTIAWAVALYLGLLVIVPYLVGHFRAKHWIEYLTDRRRNVLAAARKALVTPSLSMVDDELASVENKIRRELEAINADPSVRLAYEVQGGTDDRSTLLRIALNSAVDRDPRFIQVNRLLELLNLIIACRGAVEETGEHEAKRQVLRDYANSLQQFDTGFGPPDTAKPWGILLVGALIGSILAPVMASVGKVAAAQFGLPTE